MSNIVEYSCNLCGYTKFEYRNNLTRRLGADPEKFKVVKCKKCKLHSLYPIPNESDLEIIYTNYMEKGNRIKIENKRKNEIYPKKIKKIKKYMSGGNKILDIGSGIGAFASEAKAAGFNITGVEYEKEQVETAKKIFNVNLICDSFESFYKSNVEKYNVVNLHHVLEHLRNPIDTLIKIKTILERNGILLIEVPNEFFILRQEILIKLKRLKFPKPYNPYHHIYFFSPVTLKKMIIKSGYNILELNQPYSSPSQMKKNINLFLAEKLNVGISSKIEIIAKLM